MQTLDRALRRDLENAVKKARRTAEVGAAKAIELLAVHNHEPWPTLTVDQRRLRNRLRAHGRQLGDRLDQRIGSQTTNRLVVECAYQHWHRMLFARFLAENDLLIEPEIGMPLSLDECRELARERGADWLPMASSFAQSMLPQIFRADDPVLEVSLPAETRQEMEQILGELPASIFAADDSLGWVYQFWQAEKKEQVNKSGVKIGADELPAVTQLFTEDYMVLFLLHNTLGACWAGKYLKANPELATAAKNEEELRRACSVGGYEWTYLRFVREGDKAPWRPAAGTFDGWPREAKDITVMDPSMGSGHFLVFALPILVAFRMEEEGLSQEDAVLAVLRDNLHGLEIDPRCTQIAAFNLAFAAWKLAGYRPLSALNLACSGLALGVSKEEWLKLAERATAASPVPPKRDLVSKEENIFSTRIRAGFTQLYELFDEAPSLGSLIDPRRVGRDVFSAGFTQLKGILSALLGLMSKQDELREMAVAAGGMVEAAKLLGSTFSLVVTNVPFLTAIKQRPVMRSYVQDKFPKGKANLATAMCMRIFSLLAPGGSAAFVSPQSWMYLKGYSSYRNHVLGNRMPLVVARLGDSSFQSPDSNGESVSLSVFGGAPSPAHAFAFLECSSFGTPETKSTALDSLLPSFLSFEEQMDNPGYVIQEEPSRNRSRLGDFATAFRGVSTSDSPHFVRKSWEFGCRIGPDHDWDFLHSTTPETQAFAGMEHVILWEQESGELARLADSVKHLNHGAQNWRRGKPNWSKIGVLVSQMGSLESSLYLGNIYDTNCAAIVPTDDSIVPLLWSYCFSGVLHDNIRKINQKRSVEVGTFLAAEFVPEDWVEAAAQLLTSGLPKPQSSDPTQWLFTGHPVGSDEPMQVAVARLLGYRWPRQTGSSFMNCPALGADGLESHADDDGIVCLTSLSGEGTAADRLRALLADAYGDEWSAAKLSSLLSDVDFGGKSLGDWLRDGFFEQHCKLFHQRPFIWHIWDGLRNGFHALVNYHKLAGPNGEGRRTLEKLLYTYLGDWIDRRRADLSAGKEGADAQVTAAEHLRTELERILEGEPPYDLFVRWKPLHEQAIGWGPDINDGVRLNIRPFMTARPLNARAKKACILRTPPGIHWKKDRGKEPQREREDYPWFWSWDEDAQDFGGGKDFDGNRWNDLHYFGAAKMNARQQRDEGDQ